MVKTSIETTLGELIVALTEELSYSGLQRREIFPLVTDILSDMLYRRRLHFKASRHDINRALHEASRVISAQQTTQEVAIYGDKILADLRNLDFIFNPSCHRSRRNTHRADPDYRRQSH